MVCEGEWRKNFYMFVFTIALGGVMMLSPDKRRDAAVLTCVYCLQDIMVPPFMNRIMCFHHVITIVLCTGSVYYHYIPWDLVSAFYATEFSTVFLSLRGMGIRSKVNNILFLITFLYFRIWNLGYWLFYRTTDMPFFLMVCAYSLMMLNLWWSCKIMERVFSMNKKLVE